MFTYGCSNHPYIEQNYILLTKKYKKTKKDYNKGYNYLKDIFIKYNFITRLHTILI